MHLKSEVKEEPIRGDLVRIISHCMEGRFKPGETSRTSAAVLRSLLDYCDIFLGQAAQFQPQSVELPENFHFIGEPSAFLLYDSEKFTAVEHVWSPQNKVEGEVKHVVCRMKSKEDPQIEFFVLSWFVRETYFNYNGVRKCCLLFRQLVQLVQLLGRDLPVLVGGNYQLLPEEAEFLISREQLFSFSDVELHCLTYKPQTIRKQIRSCGFFLCGNKFLETNLENVVGTRSIKGNVILNGCRNEFWRNPEDSFYWDPMTLDLSADRIVETVTACSVRNKIQTTTPSPVSTTSFNDSEETSLQSEPQEIDEQTGSRSLDNFNSVAIVSNLQHLDLAENNSQMYQQQKLNTQREKLQELRNFLESLEMKMDAERTAASFSVPQNYVPYEQPTLFADVSEEHDDVAKSLSTICEHEEPHFSSRSSIADEFASPAEELSNEIVNEKEETIEIKIPVGKQLDFEETCQEYARKMDAILTQRASERNKELKSVEGANENDQTDSRKYSASEGTVVDGENMTIPADSCAMM